jgi:hypothetical protein
MISDMLFYKFFMSKMNRIILLSLLQIIIAFSNAYSSENEWFEIGDFKDSINFFKKGLIETYNFNNQRPSFWIKTIPQKPQKRGGKLVKSSIYQCLADCNNHKMAIRQSITYYTDKSHDSYYNSYINEHDFQTVIPESYGEYYLNYFCSTIALPSQ